jgi:hypothetical protein
MNVVEIDFEGADDHWSEFGAIRELILQYLLASSSQGVSIECA